MDIPAEPAGATGPISSTSASHPAAANARSAPTGAGAPDAPAVDARLEGLDLPALEALAVDLAVAAGRLIVRNRPDRLSVSTKSSSTDVVTTMDADSERYLIERLGRERPADAVFGEEGGARGGSSGLTWVLDPIDGTKSFVTGRPTYGSLIALLEDGVPVLGVMSQPSIGERWIGMHGRPTLFFSPIGGKAVARCRPCPALAGAQLSVTTLDLFTPDTRPRWERLAARAAQVTWGGDCYAHGLLSLGLLDLVAETTYKIWDWAALVPIVEGAGGVITDWSGRPLRPGADGSVLAAGDARLHEAARGVLNEA